MSEIVTATVTTGEIPVAFASAALDEQLVEPITLQEAKDHLRVVFDDEDEYISMLIVAAREMAEGKLNRTITKRVREQAFSSWGSMPLRKPPFIQVESLSYFDDNGAENFIEASDLSVSTRSEPARISLRAGVELPYLASQDEAIIVRYTAGYEIGSVPHMIIAWMKLVIGALYAHRESFVAGVSVSMIPEEFNKWLLQPYMVYE